MLWRGMVLMCVCVCVCVLCTFSNFLFYCIVFWPDVAVFKIYPKHLVYPKIQRCVLLCVCVLCLTMGFGGLFA